MGKKKTREKNESKKKKVTTKAPKHFWHRHFWEAPFQWSSLSFLAAAVLKGFAYLGRRWGVGTDLSCVGFVRPSDVFFFPKNLCCPPDTVTQRTQYFFESR